MIFSSPSRFFAAVAGQKESLPVVTGELQYHAVGCYSVMHDLKTALKRTELRLEQAECCAGLIHQEKDELDVAWRQACFHAFHDTLGGTCIPSAYQHVCNEIGAAEAAAERTMAYALRREVVRLAPDPLQRLIFYHPGPCDWSGWVEVEPWLEWTQWQPGWRVLDEAGEPVPFQEIAAEAMHQRQTRLLFFLKVAAGETRCLRLDRSAGGAPAVRVSAAIVPDLEWNAGALPVVSAETGKLSLSLLLRKDLTDTWSHGVDRYDGEVLAQARWQKPVALEAGPLRWAWAQDGALGERSTLRAEWRTYAGEESVVELILRVHWHEQRAVAKLEIRGTSGLAALQAGIPGGELRREPVGREFPFADWARVEQVGGGLWGVACPDVFAADARPGALALTLLRASVMAHHDPNPGTSPRREISDQGEHLFRFRFVLGGIATGEALVNMARAYVQRPLVSTTTDGMPRRYLRGEVGP
jgi:alpha-mannosidase